MKGFLRHTISLPECAAQLELFERMLGSGKPLEEQKDILTFFRENRHLASLLGTYVAGLEADLLAIEYDLFGDFVCDLAIGDSRSKTYLLVEFEDAKRESIFVTRSGKFTPEWSQRLEHAFSQVIDWFWRLDDSERSDDYHHRFGARHASIHGMIVVGRDQAMEERERRRLEWRQDHTIVHSKKVSIITFDQLARDLRYRLSRYPEAARLNS